jgi:hypothetical protein
MNRVLTGLGALAGIVGAALSFTQLLRLWHLSSTCVDSRSGTCHALDRPFEALPLAAVALYFLAWVLLDLTEPVRRKLIDLFAGTALSLQVLWLMGFVAFRARYYHPHAGGNACRDECLGAVFDYWGWIALEFILFPIVIVALLILTRRIYHLMKRN